MVESPERPARASSAPGRRTRRRAALLIGAVALIALVAGLLFRGRPALPHRDPAWLPEPRAHHAALALADGRVLVVGGSNVAKKATRPLASALLYDPAADRWQRAAAPPPTANDALWGRVLAAPLGDGRVVVVPTGGLTEQLPPPLVYDPAADRWRQTGPIDLGRAYDALALAGGGVLVLGTSEGWMRGRIYDPAGDRWREIAPPGQRYDNYAAVALADDTALIVGQTYPGRQRSAERYDPATDTWTAVAPPPDWAPLDPQAVRLADGRILFAGGYCCGPSTDRDPAAAALYDPVADRWQEAGRLLAARWSDSMALTALPDGRALVSGGHTIDRPGAGAGGGSSAPIGATNAVEVYDPATNGWAAATPLAQPRTGHTATPLRDGRLLVVGGTGPLRHCSFFEGCWPDGEFPTLAQVEWHRP